MKRKSMIGGCLALILGGVAILIGSVPFSGSASGAVTMNHFSTTCAKQGYDNTYWRKQVDPIKQYGVPVSAHMHNFYGNREISSTYSASAIQAAGNPAHALVDDPGYGPFYSNCPFYPDWPLTWFPTANLNGTETQAGMLTTTLQAPAGTTVITPPFGEAIIAGSSAAVMEQPKVRFTCGDGTAGQWTGLAGPGSGKPTDCRNVPGGVVTGEITFPDCWDGQGVTKAANGVLMFDAPYGIATSHFSYSVDGKCIAGSIPCVPGQLMAQLVTQQTWMDNRATIGGVANPDFNKPLRNPLNADGSIALSFSSGAYYTYHGDYINTWNMTYLNGLVQECLSHGSPCPFGIKVGLHILE